MTLNSGEKGIAIGTMDDKVELRYPNTRTRVWRVIAKVWDKHQCSVRVNARKTDDRCLQLQALHWPNPYLDTAALVFDFAVTNYGSLGPSRIMSQSLAIATHTCAFRKHTNPMPICLPGQVRSRKARYGSALQLECKAISKLCEN